MSDAYRSPTRHHLRITAPTLILSGLALSPLWAVEPVPAAKAVEQVEIVADVQYYTGKDADPSRQKLDIYLPKGKKDFSVLFFVHGGAWRHGDKRQLGIYSALGMFWAKHGIAAVIPNYRLTPAVVHPEHVKDVARAFAWTYKNIARYGGRREEIFVSGHSAGGHLVALLATDEVYLKAVGLSLDTIRGAIPMSGVYDLSESSRLFEVTFGADPKVRQEAAPLCHACSKAPPFLIIYAEHDLAACGKAPSERFSEALRAKHADAQTLEVKGRNHATLLLNALVESDPVPSAVLQFVAAHTHKHS
jgi:acetyl esterase/lipase